LVVVRVKASFSRHADNNLIGYKSKTCQPRCGNGNEDNIRTTEIDTAARRNSGPVLNLLSRPVFELVRDVEGIDLRHEHTIKKRWSKVRTAIAHNPSVMQFDFLDRVIRIDVVLCRPPADCRLPICERNPNSEIDGILPFSKSSKGVP